MCQCRAHILRRYAALPDEKKPFTAPAKRKHVAKDSSTDKGKSASEDDIHSDLDDEAADSYVQMDSLLPNASGQSSQSASGVTDDSARACQQYGQMPAQDVYFQPPQLSSNWQR